MQFYPFDHPKHSPSIICPFHIILLTVLKQSRYPIKAINNSHAGMNDEILHFGQNDLGQTLLSLGFPRNFFESHKKRLRKWGK